MGGVKRIFKFISSGLLLTAVVLVCILLFNTFNTRSTQITVTAPPRFSFDEQAAVQRLAGAIPIRTTAYFLNPARNLDAFSTFHKYMGESFPTLHAQLTREIVGGHSLLYTWEGTDKSLDPIALLAHQDVVEVAPGTIGDWEVPPWNGVIKGGFIWGRGTWDDKGNLFAILEAAEQLVAAGFKPKRAIYFAFGHDEETGGARGGKAIAELLKSRGIKLHFVLDEGLLITDGIIKGLKQPAALIGVSEKGYATLTLTARATPGHSSMPPRETAIGMMSAALARLEDQQMPAQIRGITAELFATLAPEMDWFNRIVLSNLWLTKPLVQRELAKSSATEAGIRTTTALTIFNAGSQEKRAARPRGGDGEFPYPARRHAGDGQRARAQGDRQRQDRHCRQHDGCGSGAGLTDEWSGLSHAEYDDPRDFPRRGGRARVDGRRHRLAVFRRHLRQCLPLHAGADKTRRSHALPRHQRAAEHRELCRDDPVLSPADAERGGVSL